MEAYEEKSDDSSDYCGSRSIRECCRRQPVKGGKTAWRGKVMGQK